MKKNKFLLHFSTFCFLICSFSVYGGGSLVKNGGRGVICLDKADKTKGATFLNQKLTQLGRGIVSTVEPLESFMARTNYEPGSTYEKIQAMGYDEALKTLHDLFKPYPWFHDQLIQAHQFLGPIERGSAMSPYGVENSYDAFTPAVLADNCVYEQIVISERDFFSIDQLLWEKLLPRDKAVLQLHEEIYFLTRKSNLNLPQIYYGEAIHGSSETTRLIAAALMTNRPDVDIPRIFRKSAFKEPIK